MNHVNILSTGLLVEAYCPARKNDVPGTPELAYQPSATHTPSLRQRAGEFLIKIGTRLANIERASVQWVEEMT
ncbi:MAG: hypothetical protein ACOYYS_04270 [Chloroflexota bacterium]